MNFATCFSPLDLYSLRLWSVVKQTREPIVKGKLSERFLLLSKACIILACSRLSCASDTSSLSLLIIACAEMSSVEALWGRGISGGISWGLQPIHSWKCEKPVDLFTVFMRWNWICGSVHTQSSWFHLTWYRRHWFTILLVRSLVPSVWGW